MPNKRFLGLGFTFSATDRGLEKKLLGIQSALSGIADSLKSINSDAQGAGAALGTMKAPRAGGRVSTPKTKDSSTSLLAELTSINKSVDKGFSDIVKSIEKKSSRKTETRQPTDSPKIQLDVAQPKAPKIELNQGTVVAGLTQVNKTLGKGFSTLSGDLDSSYKMVSSNLKNHAILFGSVIEAIEKIDFDIKIPQMKSEIILPVQKKEARSKPGILPVREDRLRKDAAYLGLLLSSQNRMTGETNKLLREVRGELKKGPRVFTKSEPQLPSQGTGATAGEKLQFGRLKTLFPRLSKDSQEFFKTVSDAVKERMGSDISKSFNKSLEDMSIVIDSTGHVAKSSVIDLHKLITEFSKTAIESDKVSKSFHTLEKAFEMVKSYLENVKGASERFLSSIGVEVSKIIPEQFHALYGILDAALLKPAKAGLIGLGKKIITGFKGEKSKDYTYKTWKAIGPGMSPTNNLQAIMSEVANNTAPKKSTGLMDILGVLLAPLALVIGLLAGFADTVNRVTKAISKLNFVKKLSEILNDVFVGFKELGPIKKLGQEIEMAVLWFKDLSVVKGVTDLFAKIGSKIGEAIEVFTSFKPIEKSIEFVTKAFEGVGKFFSSVMESMVKFGEAVFKIGAKFKPLFESPVFKAAFGLGKVIGKLATTVFLAIDVVTGLVKAYKESTGVLDFFGKALFNIADNIFMGIPSYIINHISKALSGLSGEMKTGLMLVFGGLATLIAAPFLGLSAPLIAFGAVLGAAGLAIATVVGGVVKNFGSITEGFSKLWDGIKSFFGGMIDLGGALISNFSKFLTNFDQLSSEFVKAHPIISEVIQGLGSLFGMLKDAVTPVIEAFSNLGELLGKGLGKAVGWLGDKLGNLGKSMSDQAKDLNKQKESNVVDLADYRKQRESQLAGQQDSSKFNPEDLLKSMPKDQMVQRDFQTNSLTKEGHNIVAFKNAKDMQKAFGYDVSAKDMMNPKMIGAVNDFNSSADKLNANRTAAQILDQQGGTLADLDQMASKQNDALNKALGAGTKGPGQDQMSSDNRALSELLDTLHQANDTKEMKELLQAQLGILQQQLQQTQAMIQELQKPRSVTGKINVRGDNVGMSSRSQLEGAYYGAGGS